MSRLTQAGTKQWRERRLAEQGGRCALCNHRVTKGEAVADHCHKTGRLRAVLHRGCNALLGKIENNLVRNKLSSMAKLAALLSNVVPYISDDYRDNPRYHTHRTEDEKRERRNALARKRRAEAKRNKT